MLIDDDVAILARQKGISGMTRMYGRYHTTLASHDDLTNWFIRQGVFLKGDFTTTIPDDDYYYTVTAILMENGKVLTTSSGGNYWRAMMRVFRQLLTDLPDKKGIKM